MSVETASAAGPIAPVAPRAKTLTSDFEDGSLYLLIDGVIRRARGAFGETFGNGGEKARVVQLDVKSGSI